MAPAAAIIIGEFLITHSLRVAIGPVAAGLIFGGGFYALAAVSKGRWMGGGDIKLAFVMCGGDLSEPTGTMTMASSLPKVRIP